MTYTETTTQQITFDKSDIIHWAKTFAARQMGIDISNLRDEDIKVTEDDILVTVTCTRETSNKKEEPQ